MLKWINHIQNANAELRLLTDSDSAKELEQKIELILEKITTNQNVLGTLSFLLNTQAQIKSMVGFSFEKIWKNIQLPNKKDQERTLYLLHELQYKIHQLEKELQSHRSVSSGDTHRQKQRPHDSRPMTVFNKKPTSTTFSKSV